MLLRSEAVLPALLGNLKTEVATAYASSQLPGRKGYIAETANANLIKQAARWVAIYET
jgi:hypothetical protein